MTSTGALALYIINNALAPLRRYAYLEAEVVMCFRYTLSQSQVRKPQAPAQDDHAMKATKRYHYKPRGSRSSALTNKPRKIKH